MPILSEISNSLEHPLLAGMDIVKRDVTSVELKEMEVAFNGNSETAAHNAIANNPFVFEPLLKHVGHHAMWFKNKPYIRPPLTNGKTGKIPDMLIAGKGSLGIEWFIVELKSPDDKLFSKNGSFSPVANSGLSQLAQYLIYSTEKQASIRDALEIKDFRSPKGIFVIGREDETEGDFLQELKSFWSRQLVDISICSYSRLLRHARDKHQINAKNG